MCMVPESQYRVRRGRDLRAARAQEGGHPPGAPRGGRATGRRPGTRARNGGGDRRCGRRIETDFLELLLQQGGGAVLRRGGASSPSASARARATEGRASLAGSERGGRATGRRAGA